MTYTLHKKYDEQLKAKLKEEETMAIKSRKNSTKLIFQHKSKQESMAIYRSQINFTRQKNAHPIKQLPSFRFVDNSMPIKPNIVEQSPGTYSPLKI